MQLNKQRKILVGVLSLGLGALVFDRLVLGPPEQARADSPVSAAALQAVPAPADVSGTATQALEQTTADSGLNSYEKLTQRLASMQASDALPDESHDPFALPEGWEVAKPKDPKAEEPAQSLYAQKLLADYRLSGTSKLGDEHLAVINGRPMRVTQFVKLEIEGKEMIYELFGVDNRQAVWRSRSTGELVVMRVPDILD